MRREERVVVRYVRAASPVSWGVCVGIVVMEGGVIGGSRWLSGLW